MTICRGPPVPIEDAGDHTVGVMGHELAQQRDRVLVGADGGRPRARQSEVDLVERAALPAQREMGGRLVAIDLDCDVFDEGAQQLLPVARRGRWCVPDGGEIGSECEQTIALGLRDHPRPLFFAAFQLDLGRLKCAQALLPVAFEAACHQPVVGIDSAITTLGALCLVIGSLDPEPPLLQSGFAFDFQPLSGGKGGGKPSQLQGSDEGPSDGLVDLDTADIEAIDAAVLDENLARAVVPWRSVAATVVGVQTATAMATAGQPLQKCAAFPHSAAGLVRSRPCIAGDAFLVCLIGLPVNKARMMIRDQHLPFGAWEVSHAFLAPAGGIEDDVVAGSAIDVSAGVDRVGEHLVDGGVARLDPSDLAALMHLQWEFEPLRAEPQPYAPGRAGLGELGKDLADGGADGFIRVKTNLALLLAPEEADRQATPQFAARRLVANAAIEARAQNVQLCFAHGALQPQQQPVIEHRRVIEAVAIADQRVGEAGEIDEAIPFGIVAGQARDFQTQHEADTGERHLGSEPGKAGAGRGSAARQAQVFINDDDPFGGPAELTSLAGERVLPFSRFAIVLDLSGAGLTQIDDSMAREMARRDFAALIHGSPRSLPSPACGQSGAPGSRAQRSARARRAVPRGSVRGSPKEDPPVDRAGRKKPDSVARRLPFCGGADPDRSATESVDEMAQQKQIAKAAQSTRADVGFPERAHVATMSFVPVSPLGRDQRATAVGETRQHEQNAAAADTADDSERAALKRMALARH